MKPRPLPSATRLRELFDYNAHTGVLTWKRRTPETHHRLAIWNIRYAGTRAGTIPGRYRQVGVDGQIFREHRIIWKWMTGQDPPATVDHRNLDRNDNRWANLRLATHLEQVRNHPNYNQHVGLKGVAHHPLRRKTPYQARITIDGKRTSLGYFATAEDAHTAYCLAATANFGDFARDD